MTDFTPTYTLTANECILSLAPAVTLTVEPAGPPRVYDDDVLVQVVTDTVAYIVALDTFYYLVYRDTVPLLTEPGALDEERAVILAPLEVGGNELHLCRLNADTLRLSVHRPLSEELPDDADAPIPRAEIWADTIEQAALPVWREALEAIRTTWYKTVPAPYIPRG